MWEKSFFLILCWDYKKDDKWGPAGFFFFKIDVLAASFRDGERECDVFSTRFTGRDNMVIFWSDHKHRRLFSNN